MVSSVVGYLHLVCHSECLDEPVNFNDMSISCDFCEQWFHWVCVGLKGTETFLNIERSYKRQGHAPLKHFVGSLCNGGKPE